MKRFTPITTTNIRVRSIIFSEILQHQNVWLWSKSRALLYRGQGLSGLQFVKKSNSGAVKLGLRTGVNHFHPRIWGRSKAHTRTISNLGPFILVGQFVFHRPSRPFSAGSVVKLLESVSTLNLAPSRCAKAFSTARSGKMSLSSGLYPCCETSWVLWTLGLAHPIAPKPIVATTFYRVSWILWPRPSHLAGLGRLHQWFPQSLDFPLSPGHDPSLLQGDLRHS